ncbi:hypothetical protein AMQ84_16025 [Paenibacillus riograndensis]|uniref:DUF2812 domain-containing protein n=1 Tax=Paenibacillus riograndensis TaxID=483937 RepID=A0A132TYH4_9BACL|nr:DUF2812 domain-containing protein [Paenibacillus riograndensis]KWX76196.1 hypothetical protein AMQ84_16025 [Paenibacillus riograndensis]
MRKFKFFLNFDQEEKWLNHMARQGWEFVGKSICYHFQKAEPEDAVIKMDYRPFSGKADFEDYRALFEDSGWKHIHGSKSSGYQYFRKVSGQGSEDIFSDADSKAGRYKRLSKMWLSISVAYFPVCVALGTTGTFKPSALLNPEAFYLTPGLWEKTGSSFWRAFLFETPFALFRGLGVYLLPTVIILYLFFFFKANWQYKKMQGQNPVR